jgi:hypothetical protein
VNSFITVVITKSNNNYSETPVYSFTTQGGKKESGLNTAIRSNEIWLRESIKWRNSADGHGTKRSYLSLKIVLSWIASELLF